jgi:hypothetical protein
MALAQDLWSARSRFHSGCDEESQRGERAAESGFSNVSTSQGYYSNIQIRSVTAGEHTERAVGGIEVVQSIYSACSAPAAL